MIQPYKCLAGQHRSICGRQSRSVRRCRQCGWGRLPRRSPPPASRQPRQAPWRRGDSAAQTLLPSQRAPVRRRFTALPLASGELPSVIAFLMVAGSGSSPWPIREACPLIRVGLSGPQAPTLEGPTTTPRAVAASRRRHASALAAPETAIPTHVGPAHSPAVGKMV